MPPALSMNTNPSHPWLSAYQQAVNADYDSRVVVLPNASAWQATGFDGLQIRLLEYVPGHQFRLTAQLRVLTAKQRSSLHQHKGMEALVQAGELSDQNNVYPAGIYLRDPASSIRPDPLYFGTAVEDKSDISAGLLFLSLGQFEESDTEERRINTNDEDKWLPGPEEGTQVMPLHVHGTSNAMLVRWASKASFTPRLDPCGEEILVLEGTLIDEHGRYPSGSWIRNPVKAWQSWSADAGTVIYYKNGHFPKALSCKP